MPPVRRFFRDGDFAVVAVEGAKVDLSQGADQAAIAAARSRC